MPQGVQGQVIIGGEQSYVVRWEFSYSSWTLFTCEVEMLLHVVSTAGNKLVSIYFQSVQKNKLNPPPELYFGRLKLSYTLSIMEFLHKM